MNGAIHEHGKEMMMQFADIRIGMFIAYMAILILLYIFVLYPTSRSLSRDASRTKSLMLLLHGEIVVTPGVQRYIKQNLQ